MSTTRLEDAEALVFDGTGYRTPGIFWSFNETTGATTVISSLDGESNGTIAGTPTFGVSGRAPSDQAVNCTSSDSIISLVNEGAKDQGYYILWIRIPAYPASDSWIAGTLAFGGKDQILWMSSDGKIHFRAVEDGTGSGATDGTVQTLNSINAIPLNTWTQIIVQYGRTPVKILGDWFLTEGLGLYIDGIGQDGLSYNSGSFWFGDYFQIGASPHEDYASFASIDYDEVITLHTPGSGSSGDPASETFDISIDNPGLLEAGNHELLNSINQTFSLTDSNTWLNFPAQKPVQTLTFTQLVSFTHTFDPPVRLTKLSVESIEIPDTNPNARLTKLTTEVVTIPVPGKARLSKFDLEVIRDAITSAARVSQINVEVLRSSADAPILDRTINQSITWTQSSTGYLERSGLGSSTLNFTQLTNVAIEHSNLGTNTLEFTDTLDFSLSKIATNTLEITDTLTYTHDNYRSILQIINFDESVELAQVISKTLYDTLTYIDTGSGTKTLTRSFLQAFSISTTAIGVSSKGGTTTLPFTETVVLAKILNRSIVQNLTFTQSPSIGRAGTIARNQTFILSQQGTIEYNDQYLSGELSDTALGNFVLGAIGEKVNVSHILTFSQTVNINLVHNKNMFHLLHFADTHLINFDRLQTLTDTLELSESDYKLTLPLNIGNNQTVITRPVVTITYASDIKIVLIGRKSSIVLPMPQFGNTEARQSTVSIKRTMTNKIYSYVKLNPRSTLNWTLNIPRYKASALKSFINDNISEMIYIYDWQGRIFAAYLNVNPLTFTTQGRYERELENVEIGLEFQGVKLHG